MEFETQYQEAQLKAAESLKTKLESKGYMAYVEDTAEGTVQQVLSLIPPGVSVGIPGSVTIRQLGLVDTLKKRGNAVIHHWEKDMSAEERASRLMKEMTAQVFLTGTNAITLDGCLVNIDGTGNRVAGISWSPGRLIVVISTKKICPDVESAIARVRHVATPPNSIRIGGSQPCTKLGYCTSCGHTGCPCRVISIMERATMGRDAHVVLTTVPLGY